MSDNSDESSRQSHGTKRRIDETFGPETADEIGLTEVGHSETFTFLWKIRNFSAFGAAPVESPVFTGGVPSAHQWHLSARVSELPVQNNLEHLGVHLTLVNNGTQSRFTKCFFLNEVSAAFQIQLIDQAGHAFSTFGGPRHVREFVKGEPWGHSRLLNTSLLSQPGRLPNDTLTIRCQLWLNEQVQQSLVPGGAQLVAEIEELRKRSRLEVANDLPKVYRSEEFADVTISTTNKTFKAHRAVLGARSAKFQRFFETHPSGSGGQVIRITDYGDLTVEAMLDYCYGGTVAEEAIKQRPAELVRAGQEYQLEGLKEFGELELAGTLQPENAADLLLLAHAHNCKILIRWTSGFIRAHLNRVKDTAAFQILANERPQLVAEFNNN